MLNTAYRTLRDPIERAEYLLDLEAGAVKEIRNSPPADLFEEILELQDTLDEYRATDRAQKPSRRSARSSSLSGRRLNNGNGIWRPNCSSSSSSGTHCKIAGKPPSQARAERDRILKQMREHLSNRTYVNNIVSDLVATIG